MGKASGPPVDSNAVASLSEASLSSACTAAIKEYVRGGTHRTKAKNALIKLASENETSHVPHRFLARVLYHEAAVLEAQQQMASADDKPPSEQRLLLLKEALEHSRKACALNPNSLSSAALRATLVVNVLVEESTLFSGSGSASAETIKREFQTAMAACSQAANASNPTMVEPVINISDDGSQTCDPCSLRVQDQILQWVRAGRWDCVIQEKRNVLVCMQQVLQSCHTLLDSTQIPVDGVVRLLQHILRSLLPHRPLQHDLQVWASQLLGNPGASLPESQLLLQAQQTLLQQGHQLQQGTTSKGGSHAFPAQDSNKPGSARTSNTALPTVALQSPVAGASKAKQQPAIARPEPLSVGAKPAVVESLAPSLPLFEERDWDWDKELGGSSTGGSSGGTAQPAAPATQAAARRRLRAKTNGKPVAANNVRSKERSRKERYTEVEAFWCSLNPDQRLELLRVPLAPLLQRMRAEVGQDVVEDVCEGLVMLQEQGMRSSCLWTCVMCDQKFTHAKDFLQHIEVAHEEVAVQGGKYVMCGKCQVEVVGMYYTSTCVADYSLCARCFQQELTSVPEISSAYERIYPRVPSVNGPQRWSDTGSDLVSTRDSFTSMEELDQLEGPATPKAVRLESSSHWSSPLRQAGLGATGRQAVQAGEKPLGLPAWASSPAQQRQRPASRQHSTGSTASGPSSPTIATAAAAPPSPQQSEDGIQHGSVPPVHEHQQQQSVFPSADGAACVRESASSDLSGPPQGDGGPGDAGGLLSSWWPRRLLQSWNSTGLEGSEKRCSSRDAGPADQGPNSLNSNGNLAAGAGMARVLSSPSPDPAPPTPPPAGHPTPTAGSSRTEGMVRRSSSRGSVASTAQSTRRGFKGIGSTPEGVTSAGGPADPPLAHPGRGGCGMPCSSSGCGAESSLDGNLTAVASVAMLCGSERRQLVVVVDEIMQRIRDIYGANHTIGDMALGSIMQFTERKISALLKQHILPSEAPSVRPQLEEFLAQPACVFRKPEVLRGTLRCLTLTDLHMVLVYVVRQHSDALSGANGTATAAAPAATAGAAAATGREQGELSRKPDGRAAAEHAQSSGLPCPLPQMAIDDLSSQIRIRLGLGSSADSSSDGDDVEEGADGEYESTDNSSSCECEECGQDDDEDDITVEEVGDDEDDEDDDEDVDDLTPPPLFELFVPDMSALHALIADAWHREDESGEDVAPGSSGGGAGAASSGGAKSCGKSSRPEATELDDLLLVAGLQLEESKTPGVRSALQPWLAPTQWWVSHLLEQAPTASELAGTPRKVATSTVGVRRLLQWVFGRVVHGAAEDFLQRQREYRAGRERDAALLDLYDDLAYGWRSLQAALDQRARLEELRKGARAQFAVVRHIEEEARHCHAEEAAEFLEVLMASHQAALDAASEAGTPVEHPRLNMCEAAVDVVRRHPALAGEPSQRYARALLDRELSALLLVEAMLAAEVDEAGRARATSEETLRKHRVEARETESEYTRLEAEGPACHRKKDMLDKATKEAEHRERLQDLQQRLIAVTERISAEDASKNKAIERHAEAERDLRAVRDQLRQHSTRRKHLDELCAQLEVPMPPALMHQQQQQGAALSAPYTPAPAATSCASDSSPPDGPSLSPNSDLTATPPAIPAPVPPTTPAGDTPAPTATSTSTSTAPLPPVFTPTPPSKTPTPSSPPALSLASPSQPTSLPPCTTLSLSSPGAPPVTSAPSLSLGSGIVLPGIAGQVVSAALTLEEWHKQRLEVLMYRLMWVSEAVKNFQDQYSPHARTRHYELFLKATSWAKSLADEYEQQVRGWYNELDKLREKLLEQACVDLGLVLGQHTLEIIRRRIENGARMAQEKASLSLLHELELESSARKGSGAPGPAGAMGVGVATGTPAGGAAAAAAGAKGNKNAARKQKVADKAREKKEREEAEKQARAAESEARRRAEDAERVRLMEARKAREAAIEAELERRRKELEALEVMREAEAIQAAQEASLKESIKAAAAKEQQEKAVLAATPPVVAEVKLPPQSAALPKQAQGAAAAAAPPPSVVAAQAGVGAVKPASTPRNGTRRTAAPDTTVVAVKAGALEGSPVAANAATAPAAGRVATKPVAQPAGREVRNPAVTNDRQQVRGAAAVAAVAAAAAATARMAPEPVVDTASAPKAANKHAPKFTSPAVVSANHARNASYAAGRLLSLAADPNKPPPQQPKPSVAARQPANANGHASMHANVHHANGQLAHDLAPATANMGASSMHPRGGRTPAGNSPAAKAQRSLSMPQTPEQRAAPAAATTHSIPSPIPPSAPLTAAASLPANVPAGKPHMSASVTHTTQQHTPQQADLHSGFGFNPFAENPILRALQGPERTATPASGMLGTTSPVTAPPPSRPHSQLTSPCSPSNLCSPTLNHHHPAGTYSFQNLHHLAPQVPTTPSSVAEPATDHILSIMSILEPDAQSSSSPVAPYGFRSQGSSSVTGSASAGSTHQQPQGAGTQAGGEQHSAGGDAQHTPRQALHSVKPVPGQHVLTGLAQGSSFSIWSHNAPAASEHQAADAWAMHSAGSTPPDADTSRANREGAGGRQSHTSSQRTGVVSMLSSAAAPWTGSASTSTSAAALGSISPQPTQQQQQQHTDMASMLPASLLPASLEADSHTPPAAGASGGNMRSGAVKSAWPSSSMGEAGAFATGMRPGMGQDQPRGAGTPWMSEGWGMGLLGQQATDLVHAAPAGARPMPSTFPAAKQSSITHPGLPQSYLHTPMLPDSLWSGHGASHQAGQGQADLGGWAVPYQFTHSTQHRQPQAGPWARQP